MSKKYDVNLHEIEEAKIIATNTTDTPPSKPISQMWADLYNEILAEKRRLKHQLAEKDKEIKELKFQIEDKKGGCELCEFSKELRDIDIRHQICEEIRKHSYTCTGEQYVDHAHNKVVFAHHRIIDEQMLDQIEKGE